MLNSQSVSPHVRIGIEPDLDAIRRIFNEGIEDRVATLDDTPKSAAEMETWWDEHDERYSIFVAQDDSANVVGWASLNPYLHRCTYQGVADLSVYVSRDHRGTGVGSALLAALEKHAKERDFRKIVLFALASNANGQGLYRKLGYREVGVFREQGLLEGRLVDVMAMEKILRPFVLFVCRHNTGRSQMAEAFLRRYAGSALEVASAGTIAADKPDSGVVATMAELEIDISNARPKVLDAATMARADRIITMGCDVEGVPRIDDDWGLPDPKAQPPERVRKIRDMVNAKAEKLAKELLAIP
jgi:L-amino acid N-acyltransferase YncA/protein-tyrosine-phosphatase